MSEAELTDLQITRRIAELLGWSNRFNGRDIEVRPADCHPQTGHFVFRPPTDWNDFHRACDAAGVTQYSITLADTGRWNVLLYIKRKAYGAVDTNKLRAANLALLALLEAREKDR